MIISSFDDNQSIISIQPEPTPVDQAIENDFKAENNLRPNSFETYIGQEKLQEILKISISAARKRNDLASIGHILLYGPPGLGKTSCAYLLAKELGTNVHVFSAPALDRPKDILGILMSASPGDVIFVDEIHRLNKVTEELLYPALEDYEVDLSSGKGNSSRIMRIKINKFIFIGATTKLGLISAPLRDRFTHIHRMEYYSPDELCKIIKQNSKILQVEINSEAADIIAHRSRGTPRIVNRLLRLVRDFAQHHNKELIDFQTANEALDLFRIDKAGLDLMDRKILHSLCEKYKGGPAGVEAIASMVGEDRSTIEDYYEPFLIQSGFLIRTKRGRMVTDKAYEYLKS